MQDFSDIICYIFGDMEHSKYKIVSNRDAINNVCLPSIIEKSVTELEREYLI